MTPRFSQPGRHLLDGTVWVFLAEALVLPTGLVTAAFLTRRLGPEGYGIFSISAAIVIWLEVSVAALFSRASFKFIAEAADWKPLSATLLWWHAAVGSAAAILVWLLSPALGLLLHEPGLVPALRLFAVDIPLFCVAQAHKNLLIGLGAFRERALSSAARWMSRLMLIVLLVELGLSVEGAIWGSLGATLVELVMARWCVRPPIFERPAWRLPGFWTYAWPLWLFSVGTALLAKLDLLMLKALGGTAAEAGIYSAAQNLAIVPAIFATAFAPLLLSTLSRLNQSQETALAKDIAAASIRAVILLLPFAALTAAMARELSLFVFGPRFAEAAPILSCLIFAALAAVMVSITTAIMTAAGKPGWPLAILVPLLALAPIGYLSVIPGYGPRGAAAVTALVTMAGAAASLVFVGGLWGVGVSPASLLRSVLVST
ncbi:MAG TPA: oligosaccharide flippase family protein, partial [Candidatus Eisenbacteria bacterium]|nr:oligosaccharide flippase family protein [Candidatus Eisenbacteria bacterium]